jgi:hypothetical protein
VTLADPRPSSSAGSLAHSVASRRWLIRSGSPFADMADRIEQAPLQPRPAWHRGHDEPRRGGSNPSARPTNGPLNALGVLAFAVVECIY